MSARRKPRKANTTTIALAIRDALLRQPLDEGLTMAILEPRGDDRKSALEHMSNDEMRPLFDIRSRVRSELRIELEKWHDTRLKQASFDAKWMKEADDLELSATSMMQRAAELRQKAREYAAARGR